jgi:hypothetical protein
MRRKKFSRRLQDEGRKDKEEDKAAYNEIQRSMASLNEMTANLCSCYSTQKNEMFDADIRRYFTLLLF